MKPNKKIKTILLLTVAMMLLSGCGNYPVITLPSSPISSWDISETTTLVQNVVTDAPVSIPGTTDVPEVERAIKDKGRPLDPNYYNGGGYDIRGVHEVIIPREGETVTYPDGYTLFENSEGERICPVSATRQDGKISFVTQESEYYFSFIMMVIITSDGEALVGLNVHDKHADTFSYVLNEYPARNEDDRKQIYNKYFSEVKNALGDSYDPEKNYVASAWCQGLHYLEPQFSADSEYLYMGVAREVKAVDLPKDGATVYYPQGYVMYETENGEKFLPVSATRSGNVITFVTQRTDYRFDRICMNFVTPQGDIFVGIYYSETKDGSFIYTSETYRDEYKDSLYRICLNEVYYYLPDTLRSSRAVKNFCLDTKNHDITHLK